MLSKDMSGSDWVDMTKAGAKARKRQIRALRERVHGDPLAELPEETRAAQRSLRRRVALRTGRAILTDGSLCRCPLCTAPEWRPYGSPQRTHTRHCRCEPCLVLSALYRED